MTTRTSLASARTEGQEEQYRLMVRGFTEEAVDLALRQVVSDREGWQSALDNGGEIKRAAIEAVVAKTREMVMFSEQLRWWVKFYREEFGIKLDVENLVIPTKRPGFDRLLMIAKGLTALQVFKRCRLSFKCGKGNGPSLDNLPIRNDRDAKDGSYAIWVRDVQEADHFACQVKEADVAEITLLERLVYELVYYRETGKHLDIHHITLCLGTRVLGINVPYVYFRDGSFRVSHGGYDPVAAGDDLVCYGREVVTAPRAA